MEISSAHFLFWDPLHISVTNGARKLKFGKAGSRFKDIVKQQLEEEMQTKVDDTVKRFTGNIQEVKKSSQETKEQADEHRDKESRRNNIIIYNVPESEEPRLDDRNRCD